MLIYTNFDIWNMSKRNIKLGKAIYNKQTWDLDNLSQAFELINILVNDQVIQISNNLQLIDKPSDLHEYQELPSRTIRHSFI
jgi:hypothetical protein